MPLAFKQEDFLVLLLFLSSAGSMILSKIFNNFIK